MKPSDALHFPTLRDPPADVTARLRDIDPTAALVYIGMGHWLLGSVQPHAQRRQMANDLIRRQYERPVERRRVGMILWGRLLAQGFRPIAYLYDEADLQSGYIVADFQLRDWQYRNRAEAAFMERAHEADDQRAVEEKVTKILDAVHGEWPDVHRRVFQKRRSAGLQPGLN